MAIRAGQLFLHMKLVMLFQHESAWKGFVADSAWKAFLLKARLCLLSHGSRSGQVGFQLLSQILLDFPRLLAAVAGLGRLGVRHRGRHGTGGLLATGNLTVLLLAATLLHVIASVNPAKLCTDERSTDLQKHHSDNVFLNRPISYSR